MSRAALVVLGFALGLNTVYMGREWDVDELKAKKMVPFNIVLLAPKSGTNFSFLFFLPVMLDYRRGTFITVGQDKTSVWGYI